ncbi:hypothetical protein QEG98_28140 [Myxococcus sp. MxC21-1]|uniref:hypothetical protein n=1 Tax=Myxococcus sp. MxC21-1 TaxID=3041439 RepID=UPI00292CB76B|nr:hypothetical protein [Myxococcus sp. MxC21-1]WNZ59876.1 hypothetical protein QEG98_28140 [Myxococcus sp. MxC21-1]
MRLHRLLHLAAVAVLAAVVGACEPPIHIKLASAAEQLPSPEFIISEPSQPVEKPRYSYVSVMDLDGTLMWAFRKRPPNFEVSPARLSYGVLPEGFEELEQPKPLVPGRTYSIGVSGEGSGGFHFHVSHDGTIREAR